MTSLTLSTAFRVNSSLFIRLVRPILIHLRIQFPLRIARVFFEIRLQVFVQLGVAALSTPRGFVDSAPASSSAASSTSWASRRWSSSTRCSLWFGNRRSRARVGRVSASGASGHASPSTSSSAACWCGMLDVVSRGCASWSSRTTRDSTAASTRHCVYDNEGLSASTLFPSFAFLMLRTRVRRLSA